LRPIEKKVYDKINENGMLFEQIWEIVDNTDRQELKKSFPDELHFQTSKLFAKIIEEGLIRSGKIRKDNNRLFRKDLDQKKEKEKSE